MQRILAIARDIINSLEICDEDTIQDIYLWVIQNKLSLITNTDDYIKNKIMIYIDALNSNNKEYEFEEFNDQYPSYDSIDELNKYFISESVRSACRKLSRNKQFIIYYSFGFGGNKPLSPYELSTKFHLPISATIECKKEALEDLKQLLKYTF